jgi:hypothetical protein
MPLLRTPKPCDLCHARPWQLYWRMDRRTGVQIMPLMMKYAVLLGWMAGCARGDRRWEAYTLALQRRCTTAEWVARQVNASQLAHHRNEYLFCAASKVKATKHGPGARLASGGRAEWGGRDWTLAAEDPPPKFITTMREDRKEDEETLDQALEEEVRKMLSLEGYVMVCTRCAVAQLPYPDVCRLLAGQVQTGELQRGQEEWFWFEGKGEYNGFSLPRRSPAEQDKGQPADDIPGWAMPWAELSVVDKGVATLIRQRQDNFGGRTPDQRREAEAKEQDGRLSARATSKRDQDVRGDRGDTGGGMPPRILNMSTPSRADQASNTLAPAPGHGTHGLAPHSLSAWCSGHGKRVTTLQEQRFIFRYPRPPPPY